MPSFFGKEDIGDSLGVSLATVSNWIKTGVIPPPNAQERYSAEDFATIIRFIADESGRLHSRANRNQSEKKYSNYLGIRDRGRQKVLASLLSTFGSSGLSVGAGVAALSIAMLKFNSLYRNNTPIHKRIGSWLHNLGVDDDVADVFSGHALPNRNDDLVGAFYQSIQNVSSKARRGSYYTPAVLLGPMPVATSRTVIDPCCGSGSILLGMLNKQHDPSLVYARDIDPIALLVCATNLVLFFDDAGIQPQVEYGDIVFPAATMPAGTGQCFDYVVTNPPWGSKYSREQKVLLAKAYPELRTAESFSIAVKNTLEMLQPGGELLCFLPYSVLNVAQHRNIRKLLLGGGYNIHIKTLGNAFAGVVSESIALRVRHSTSTGNGSILIENVDGQCHAMRRDRVRAPNYIIAATAFARDENILDKICGVEHSTLASQSMQSDFALGIVTGNNAQHLLSTASPQSEPVFRGKDILPYRYANPELHIIFQETLYQQVAPLRCFRQRKIVYKFISDHITCALDEGGCLIVNSANMFVAHGYPMETIVCLFNSPIYTFIFRKKFHSKKVLKWHLQSLPLPTLSPAQHARFFDLYKNMMSGVERGSGLESRLGTAARICAQQQKLIDREICTIFQINADEYAYIQQGSR